MAKAKHLVTFFGVAFVVVGTTASILFAKGYRLSFDSNTIKPSGILVAQSYPDGAQLFINGELKNATNTNLNLEPGTYQVEIKKDGFAAWKKTLQIQAEVVTRATATLFPSAPSMRAITSTGADIPSLSPDGSKVIFTNADPKQPRLFLLDLNESPLGLINRDPKPIPAPKINLSNFFWSPDSRTVLANASSSAYLIDIGALRVSELSVSQAELQTTSWQAQARDRELRKTANLPEKMREFLLTAATHISFSPKEDKVLYTATASAVLPDNLIPPLPGSSTQPQSRAVTPGGVYVYDIEEDRNFYIDTIAPTTPTISPKKTAKNPGSSHLGSKNLSLTNAGWTWFPNSYHLIKVDGNKIIVKEYDNQNPNIIYSGPMENSFAAAYPSGTQVLILANLNTASSPIPNLYSISLR